MSERLVLKRDVIAAGYCASGLREWARLHGISADDIRSGLPEDRLADIDCELARKVLNHARRRWKDEHAGGDTTA